MAVNKDNEVPCLHDLAKRETQMIKKTKTTICSTPYVLKALKRVTWQSVLRGLSTHLSQKDGQNKGPSFEKVKRELDMAEEKELACPRAQSLSW